MDNPTYHYPRRREVYRPGDHVRLCAGGSPMRVIRSVGGRVTVVWFAIDGKQYTGCFEIWRLEKCP